jgi:hypothetical protein
MQACFHSPIVRRFLLIYERLIVMLAQVFQSEHLTSTDKRNVSSLEKRKLDGGLSSSEAARVPGGKEFLNHQKLFQIRRPREKKAGRRCPCFVQQPMQATSSVQV